MLAPRSTTRCPALCHSPTNWPIRASWSWPRSPRGLTQSIGERYYFADDSIGAEALTVPPANVELVRKHEADIEKYAMHGLAFLGL